MRFILFTSNIQLLKNSIVILLLFSLVISLSSSCNNSDKSITNTLFESLSADQTNIDFENTLNYTNEFNIYKYRNYYNGGGVGLGDVNNDGLIDVYFTANLLSNKLYLNKGNFTFETNRDKNPLLTMKNNIKFIRNIAKKIGYNIL